MPSGYAVSYLIDSREVDDFVPLRTANVNATFPRWIAPWVGQSFVWRTAGEGAIFAHFAGNRHTIMFARQDGEKSELPKIQTPPVMALWLVRKML